MRTLTQSTLKNLLNVRRIAVHNRLSEDIEIYVEKCYRYFSKTYSVSLIELKEKLSPEEVALVFMEDEMEEWTVEQVKEMKVQLDDSERAMLTAPVPGEDDDSELDDESWIAEQNKILKKQDVDKSKKAQEDVIKKTHAAIEQLTQTFKKTTEDLKKETE